MKLNSFDNFPNWHLCIWRVNALTDSLVQTSNHVHASYLLEWVLLKQQHKLWRLEGQNSWIVKFSFFFPLEMMWTSACKWFFCEGWPFGDSWILSNSSLENGDISQLPQNRKGLRWWWEWQTSIRSILYARVACNHGRCCEFAVYCYCSL